MKTRFLFVFAKPPYSSLHVQELLDMVLTAAAFDQPVSLLLVDDGVYSLKTGQQPEALNCRDIKPLFESLELYDIEHIYVEAESLAERNLTADALSLPVELLNRAQVGALLKQQNRIVNV